MMRFLRRRLDRSLRNFGQSTWMMWRALTAPLRWLQWSFQAIFRMLSKWYRSRHWRRLIWGLPILVVFSAALYFLILHVLTRPSQLATRYTLAGQSATRAEQWNAATLYLERAVELGVRNPQVLFDLAVAAERSGDENRKIAVLGRLAPDDRPVHAPAHLWRAVQFLSVTPVSPENQKAAENQLRLALQLDAGNVNVHALLGDLYFQRGFYDGAVNHLGKASKTIARYQLLHARACIFSGRAVEARQSAIDAKNISESQLAENPSDVQCRLELSQALHFLEEFDAAVRVLQQGYDTVPDPAVLRAAVTKVYLSWADHVLLKKDNPTADRTLAFELISHGMLANPDDPDILTV